MTLSRRDFLQILAAASAASLPLGSYAQCSPAALYRLPRAVVTHTFS
jgi:anaerobic selenocysteine-containing dehydrogenase